MRAYEPDRKFRILNTLTREAKNVFIVDAREHLITKEWTQPATFDIFDASTGEARTMENSEAVLMVGSGKFSWVPLQAAS